jgi:hypothetical protein
MTYNQFYSYIYLPVYVIEVNLFILQIFIQSIQYALYRYIYILHHEILTKKQYLPHQHATYVLG